MAEVQLDLPDSVNFMQHFLAGKHACSHHAFVKALVLQHSLAPVCLRCGLCQGPMPLTQLLQAAGSP